MTDIGKSDRLLSIKVLVELTGMSESFFRVGWCRGKLKLPFVKLGKAVRVKQSDYEKWLDGNMSSTMMNAGVC